MSYHEGMTLNPQTIVQAVRCRECRDLIYSRAVHDFHRCTCGYVFVDGGFSYLRYGAKDMSRIEVVKLEVNATKKELYEDWNRSKDKYGTVRELVTQ